jgi:uncharacterized membrane protein
MGKSRLKSRRRQDQGLKWARVTMAILATIGVIDTGSITFNRWGWIGALTCPGGAEGCDKVLNSPWGTLIIGNGLGIPLSLLGLISYLTVLCLAILPLLPGLSQKKADLTRRTWWGLFFASCGMAVFSLILMGLMIFKIQAFCFFCLLSALISLSLLGLSIIGGGWDEPRELVFRGLLVSLAFLLGGLIWASSASTSPKSTDFAKLSGIAPPVQTKSTSAAITLAKHLQSEGVVMYSAYWCPHCHEQKEVFGQEAVSNLVIIECAIDGLNNQRDLCERKGITGYPSWEIKGELESGIQSLEELADLSGYQGPRNF